MTINRAMPPPAIMTLAALLLLSACDGAVPRADDRQPSHPVTAAVPAPLPPRAQVARPPAPPLPAMPTHMPDWRDVPLAAGDWTWGARAGGSEARFGMAGQAPVAILQCDRSASMVRLSLPYDPASGPAPQATITTSTSSGTVAVERQTIDGQAVVAIALPASNRLLDAMAFSRGRFLVQIEGANWHGVNWIALPAWSEVGRVVEDCRG